MSDAEANVWRVVQAQEARLLAMEARLTAQEKVIDRIEEYLVKLCESLGPQFINVELELPVEVLTQSVTYDPALLEGLAECTAG